MRADAVSPEAVRAFSAMSLLRGYANEPTPKIVITSGDNAIQLSVSTPLKHTVHWVDTTFVLRGDRGQLLSCGAMPDGALFQLFLQQWYIERGATSSITEMASCRSYLRIIGMGERAIPLILRQMQDEGDEPDMWFVALQVLTGADPVTDEIRGDFKAMAERWLQSAIDIGYAW
jgi:hypothetical protein